MRSISKAESETEYCGVYCDKHLGSLEVLASPSGVIISSSDSPIVVARGLEFFVEV